MQPVILRLWEREFKVMLENAVARQCDMLKFQIQEAAELGVDISLQLDPTKIPLGLDIYFVQYEESEKSKEKHLKIVPEDDDEE